MKKKIFVLTVIISFIAQDVTFAYRQLEKDEILQIADAMMETNCKKYEFELKTFSKDAKELLLSYNWPGNIRELISVVERAVILSENQEITADELFLQNKIQ